MTQYTFNAETGTAGANVPSADFTVVGKTGTATVTYSATGKAHGALGYRAVSAGTATVNTTDKWQIRKDLNASAAQVSQRVYFTLNSLPSQAQNLVMIIDTGGAQVFGLGLLGGNTVRAVGAGGSTLGSYATALTAGTLYRVEFHWRKGTTTADGQAAMSLFAGDSATALWTYGPVTNVNVGTNNALQVWLGDNTAPRTSDITFDDWLVDDAVQTYLGPAGNTPPTVSVNSNQNVAAAATVNLTSTRSDADGTIASEVWAHDFPSSGGPSITGSTSQNASFTAGSAGSLYVTRHTVTDDGGATAFATTETRVPATGTITPLAGYTPTGAGTWTNTGGAASEGAALSDGSDTTYVESGTATVTEQTRRWRLSPSAVRSTGTITVRVAQSAAGTIVAKARLFEGATQRQEWTLTTTTSPADQVLTVTTPGAIGDWGNLFLELSVTS